MARLPSNSAEKEWWASAAGTVAKPEAITKLAISRFMKSLPDVSLFLCGQGRRQRREVRESSRSVRSDRTRAEIEMGSVYVVFAAGVLVKLFSRLACDPGAGIGKGLCIELGVFDEGLH